MYLTSLTDALELDFKISDDVAKVLLFEKFKDNNKVEKALYYLKETDFSGKSLIVILNGIEKDVDVSIYADYKYDYRQMEQIYLGLISGINVSLYADNKFDNLQMIKIRQGLEQGIDVSWYADPKYSWTQMEEIKLGLLDKLDVSKYNDPTYPYKKMKEIRFELLKEKNQV